MKAKAYLVGPITGVSYGDATDWRKLFSEALTAMDIQAISPMRGKEYLENETAIRDSYEDFPLSSEQGIFGRDLYDVRTCDILVCNFLGAERASIGSVAEIAVAYENHKFILVIMESGNIHDHAFIRRFASTIVSNLDDAITTLAILTS